MFPAVFVCFSPVNAVIFNHFACVQDVADNQVDTGDLMECLVQNKHQKEMNDKCLVGVTHFQLVSFSCHRNPLFLFKTNCTLNYFHPARAGSLFSDILERIFCFYQQRRRDFLLKFNSFLSLCCLLMFGNGQESRF